MQGVWHRATVGYATIGQAPIGPVVTNGFFHTRIQFVVVVHSSIYLSARRNRHQIPSPGVAKQTYSALYGIW